MRVKLAHSDGYRAILGSMSLNVLAFLVLMLLFIYTLSPSTPADAEVDIARSVHAICERCWSKHMPKAQRVRAPVTIDMVAERVEVCCICATLTMDGIYTKDIAQDMGCKHIREPL